jgi:hypothetical protein
MIDFKDSDLIQTTEVHGMGEIWAVMLNEMYWNLVDDFGFSEDIFDSTQSHGNIVALQLMMGGMMIQPCNPTFLDARDAILQADVNYYNGKHQCQIWKAFAKRGMGVKATKFFQDDQQVPEICGSYVPVNEVIDIYFKWDYTNDVSSPLKVGSYVRIAYDISRIGEPCAAMLICTFMDKDKPFCEQVEYQSYTMQALFLLKKPGKLNIFIHVPFFDS